MAKQRIKVSSFAVSYTTKDYFTKFLDAGIQDVSTSISIIHDLTEMSDDDDDGDESDKHI